MFPCSFLAGDVALSTTTGDVVINAANNVNIHTAGSGSASVYTTNGALSLGSTGGPTLLTSNDNRVSIHGGVGVRLSAASNSNITLSASSGGSRIHMNGATQFNAQTYTITTETQFMLDYSTIQNSVRRLQGAPADHVQLKFNNCEDKNIGMAITVINDFTSTKFINVDAADCENNIFIGLPPKRYGIFTCTGTGSGSTYTQCYDPRSTANNIYAPPGVDAIVRLDSQGATLDGRTRTLVTTSGNGNTLVYVTNGALTMTSNGGPATLSSGNNAVTVNGTLGVTVATPAYAHLGADLGVTVQSNSGGASVFGVSDVRIGTLGMFLLTIVGGMVC